MFTRRVAGGRGVGSEVTHVASRASDQTANRGRRDMKRTDGLGQAGGLLDEKLGPGLARRHSSAAQDASSCSTVL